jgi:hypothetical protein
MLYPSFYKSLLGNMGVSCRTLLSFSLQLAIIVPSAFGKPLCGCEKGVNPQDIITKDVAIIGGGATGTYSAIRLRDDFNKKIILIEKEAVLGGHTQTYFDPTTGAPIDYGVQAWLNNTATTGFFGRLGVNLLPAVQPNFTTIYADLSSGKPTIGYPSADPTSALLKYAGLLQQWPYLAVGYNLTYPVPDDLLLPFGDFVTKYDLSAALPVIFTFAQGLGNFLKEPTLYVIQNFGLLHLQALQSNGFVIPVSHYNHEVYDKALAHLGSDVLLSSKVLQTCRDVNGMDMVLVKTPAGTKLIKAKALLVTIPPTTKSLQAFDLDHKEWSVFSQFKSKAYFGTLIRNSGIPDNTSLVNAAANTQYHIPREPFVTTIDYTGLPGLHRANYVGPSWLNVNDAKAGITKAVLSLKSAGTFATAKRPDFAAIGNHNPSQMRVDAKQIAQGFYGKLYSLQGYKKTFYTGAAWASDYSSILWLFTEGILPYVVQASA